LLRRSNSFSNIYNLPAQATSIPAPAPSPIAAFTNETRMMSMSLRSLHCSILHPRAPKIRHLNSSHALLVDLDKHIAKVQELEYKVAELEARIAEREALKQIPLQNQHTDNNSDRLVENLVTEEERIAFQNRLNSARRRAEQLSRETNIQEANILRSWHSKKLKDVLEALSTAYNSPADAPLLLAAPAATTHGELEQENAIFDALNALVGMANEEAELDNNEELYIQQLRNLVIERENLKLVLEGASQKLTHARTTALECQVSLQNMLASASALRLQLKSSQAYLMGSLLREDMAQKSSQSNLWIYGPNPIFTGVGRIHEITSSLQNNALEEALFKTEISTVIAEKNLAFAHKLVHKHKLRKEAGKVKLSQVETLIEKQIEAINAMEDNTKSAAKIVEEVCNKKSVECDAQKSAKCDAIKSANSEIIGLECDNNKNSVNDPSTLAH